MQHAVLVQTMPTVATIHLLHGQYHPFLMRIKLSSSRGRSQGCYLHLNQVWVLPYQQGCPQPDGNMLLHSHQAPKSSDANHFASSPPFCHSAACLVRGAALPASYLPFVEHALRSEELLA